MSGTKCHPCLGPLIHSQPFIDAVRIAPRATTCLVAYGSHSRLYRRRKRLSGLRSTETAIDFGTQVLTLAIQAQAAKRPLGEQAISRGSGEPGRKRTGGSAACPTE